MQLALNNRSKTIFSEFGLPSVISYSPQNITVPRSVRPCRRFLQDSIHCHFLSKAWLAVRHRTASFPTRVNTLSSFSNTEHRIQKWFIHIKVYFVLSKKQEHSSRCSRHFVPTDQNKLCTHDKNMKRAELWVKINLSNVFEMYALGSVRSISPRSE